MEDAADLGLSAVEYALDRYHDRVFDVAATVPGHVRRRIPDRLRRRRRRSQPQSAEEQDADEAADVALEELEEADRLPDSQAAEPQQGRAGMYLHDTPAYDDGRQGAPAYGQGDRDIRRASYHTYGSDPIGRRNDAPGNIYDVRGGYTYPDTRAPPPPYVSPTYGEDAYNQGRSRQQRYIEYDRRDYGPQRARSSENIHRSRYREGSNDDDRRRLSSRGTERVRDRSRSRTRKSGRAASGDRNDPDSQSELKKWGATLAGAAIGAYGGHRTQNDGWVPAAIGAVVGGLVAREAEKEVSKRRHERRDERRVERYRSSSR